MIGIVWRGLTARWSSVVGSLVALTLGVARGRHGRSGAGLSGHRLRRAAPLVREPARRGGRTGQGRSQRIAAR